MMMSMGTGSITGHRVIGGSLATSVCGWIELLDLNVQRIESSAGAGTSRFNGFIVDVRNWTLRHRQHEVPLVCSGLLGVPTSRRVGHSYSFEIDTFWDHDVIPEVRNNGPQKVPSIRQLKRFQMYMLLGNQDGYQTGVPETIYESTKHRMWYCPLCAVEEFGPTVAVEADGAKLIRQTIKGLTCCAPLILPDDGSPNDMSTLAGAYCAYIKGSKLI